MYNIPLTQTTIGEEEVGAASRVLRSDWLTMGQEVATFEEEFAALLGVSHAIAVTNGTLALEVAFDASGLEPGGEIVLPAITFVAAFNVAIRRGLRPVLADLVSEDNLTMCPDSLRACLRENTRAVSTMPYGGFAPQMVEIEALCAQRGVVLLEDSCHAPLAKCAGRPIGSFGLGGTWSFFGNKNLTTGEGGMITTNDDEFAARCRRLRSHGMTRMTWERSQGRGFSYDVVDNGTNARMDEIRAAIGREQLKKLTAATEHRRQAATWMRTAFEEHNIPGLSIPFRNHDEPSAHHLFVVLLPEGVDRQGIMDSMRGSGVQTSIHYPPLYSLKVWEQYAGDDSVKERLPIAHAVAGRLLSLPMGPAMTRAMCEEVASALAKALAMGGGEAT